MVLQNRSYDFHGTVQSSLGAIKFDATISVMKNGKVIDSMVAKLGNCVDPYVDLKAH
jgi:hypothetical protein